MKDLMEQIHSVKVNPEYAISLTDYRIIYDNSKNDVFLLMHNSFLVGYMQGQKAEQEESKKYK